ncbi:cbb3-type cytochrome oxidase assembly protein CcoS [Marilutibacter chinensis]|uniref:Cbb3-type cytochrome oxidase assembly protein CcoS n=1 Tax=Marilutibacter chinensis TaxID=2912247 RepID=A0ABS9HR69_9GAMM|nr:cbb3-type cytochrome oxidase assembly protein CcoS [Lysobacter chinensis]MCF7221421.1 cbb3-type cytochrome oxidase assembly protein CcoS [Lysobacter chinensis]
MNILLLLIPLSLMLLVAAIAMFVWAVRRGQFDDLDTPALDILRDDPEPGLEASPSKPVTSGAPRAAAAHDAD